MNYEEAILSMTDEEAQEALALSREDQGATIAARMRAAK